jgi:plastocyanin
MTRTWFLMGACLAGSVAVAPLARAQSGAVVTAAPHSIVITLVERPGAMLFAFEPSTFTAERGDTLRFVQAAATMHNVHFKTQPKGAKLGSAAISPYLVAKGQAYTVVVDSRFTDGTYELVCDPHETIGMHAFLTVHGTALASK